MLIMDVPVEQAAERIGVPLQAWPGRCAQIVHLLITHGLAEGKETRGIWLGPINPASIFYGRLFTQHSWIITPYNRIIDPTRFAFEAAEPYIWIGNNDDGYYDAGGNMIRAAFMKPCPDYNTDDREVTLNLDADAAMRVYELLNGKGHYNIRLGYYHVTLPIALWLANLPLSLLGAPAVLTPAIGI